MKQDPDMMREMWLDMKTEQERKKALETIKWFNQNEKLITDYINQSFNEQVKKRNIKW